MQIDWNKPSEELPKEYRMILFVDYAGHLRLGYMTKRGIFADGSSDADFTEEQIKAWCYAPSLPEWCEEELHAATMEQD